MIILKVVFYAFLEKDGITIPLEKKSDGQPKFHNGFWFKHMDLL
jgi:hypothetical protein